MLLYHYTDIHGLVGILTTKTLWASDCRFLNDGQELEYAKKLFFDEWAKLELPQPTDGGYRIPPRGEWHIRMFVTCFSEIGDLLSQWRGYGSTQGYAFGFDPDLIQVSYKSQEVQNGSDQSTAWEEDYMQLGCSRLERVQYGIDDPAEYFREDLAAASRLGAHPGVSGAARAELMFHRIARIKHPGFQEEREWRWMKPLSRHACNEGESIHFRASKFGPIAYITNQFPPEALREIIIGPGPHSEEIQSSLFDMLHCHGMGHRVEIRTSVVPLRQ